MTRKPWQESNWVITRRRLQPLCSVNHYFLMEDFVTWGWNDLRIESMNLSCVCVCAASQGCHWCVLGKLEIGFVLCWLQACIAISLSTVEDPSCHHKKLTSIRNPFFPFLMSARSVFAILSTRSTTWICTLKPKNQKKLGAAWTLRGQNRGANHKIWKKYEGWICDGSSPGSITNWGVCCRV